MLTRTPKQPKPKQSSFDTLFEEFSETPPYDIRPPSERNDYLQSSVGKDRANRREDVATAARVMAEVGDISHKDAAINGDLTPTFEAGVERMQARAKRDNPDVTVDRVYGPQTQAIALEIERPKARANRADINAGMGNLLIEPGERPPAPKPMPIDAATAKHLIQNQLAVRRAEQPEPATPAPVATTDPAVLPTDAVASADTSIDEPVLQPSCLVPEIYGALFSQVWKDALWDRYFTGAPARQRRSVEQYKIVKRA